MNFSATKRIFNALVNGRRLSQMDCKEFEIEDMRTPISHMKNELWSNGFDIQSQWIETPKGRRIKQYWAIKVA